MRSSAKIQDETWELLWEERTRAKAPATIMPRAEAPLTEAAPVKIGEPVGAGGEVTPVDPTDPVPDGAGKPADGAGVTDGSQTVT